MHEGSPTSLPHRVSSVHICMRERITSTPASSKEHEATKRRKSPEASDPVHRVPCPRAGRFQPSPLIMHLPMQLYYHWCFSLTAAPPRRLRPTFVSTMRLLVLLALVAVVNCSEEEMGGGEGTFHQMRILSTPAMREGFINIVHTIMGSGDYLVRNYLCPGVKMDDRTACSKAQRLSPNTLLEQAVAHCAVWLPRSPSSPA